ncbi:hypothetical protein SAMN05421858_0670 [Haladaptatus litoreus]|uniref:Uncharacterized protein n=1 Tax=Haladaptatus litoreus TaxID=553468 RepID=A0A1N6WCA9_9EURY|nr:hypothetical protein SAMN05421858_0670 [Haladaptatus litoreus]
MAKPRVQTQMRQSHMALDSSESSAAAVERALIIVGV